MPKIKMKPLYTFKEIKYGIDQRTYDKAVGLYENNKIISFKETPFGFSATVQGTQKYKVEVGREEYDAGSCNCYLGQHDTLCKHMIAVAFHASLDGRPIPEDEKVYISEPICSRYAGMLSKDELAETRKRITAAMKYIKAYTGPSRTWFQYQNSLFEGRNRLAEIVSNLPVSLQTAKLLINMIIRLDKKLVSGGVDDSDGTVGGFIEDVVCVLIEYSSFDSKCIQAFKKLEGISGCCFNWKEPLLMILHNYLK